MSAFLRGQPSDLRFFASTRTVINALRSLDEPIFFLHEVHSEVYQHGSLEAGNQFLPSIGTLRSDGLRNPGE